MVRGFGPDMLTLGERVFASALGKVPSRFWRETRGECLLGGQSRVHIAAYRRRPTSQYYKEHGKPIPAPANPYGTHATRLETSVSLVAPGVTAAHLHGSFRLKGEEERTAFLALLADFERPLAKLVEGRGYEFTTPIPFLKVDRYRGRDAMKKLLLYAQYAVDEEQEFELSRDFWLTDRLVDVELAMLPLVALFDSVLGYLRRRKDQDRLLWYTELMGTR